MGEENVKHNPKCKSSNFKEHLCYIVSQGFHLNEEQKYKALIEGPQFKCEHCGRVAKSENNLCEPVKL